MRVMMLSQFYPPLIGGIEQHVRSLGIELVARGHNVSVLTLWHPGLSRYEIDQGVKVYRIRGTVHRLEKVLSKYLGRIYPPPFPDPELVYTIRKLIIQEKPQIIHAHNWLIHSFLPLKTPGSIPLILTLNDYSKNCAKWTLINHNEVCEGPGLGKCVLCSIDNYGLKGIPIVLSNSFMGRIENTKVDIFFPVSNAVAQNSELVKKNLPYHVIPNFLPEENGDSIDQKENDGYLAQLPNQEFLLFVGHLGRNKGVDVLIKAYARIKEAPPLVMIGYDTSKDPYRISSVPANVYILKNWPHKAVMIAWKRSIIGLAPSIWEEPFGIVLLEAMYAGRPVIASKIGGITDIVVDGKTGILVPPGDDIALQEAIERLIVDIDLRNQMGQAGKKRVVEFQAVTVIPRIERIYESLINQK